MGTGIAAPCTKVVHPSVKWINLWDLPIEAISQNRHHRWVLLTHLTLVKSKVQPRALAGSPAIPIFLLAVYFVLNIPWHHSTTRSTLHWWLHWCCLVHPYRISFVKFITNLHPALKLTWTISGNSPPLSRSAHHRGLSVNWHRTHWHSQMPWLHLLPPSPCKHAGMGKGPDPKHPLSSLSTDVAWPTKFFQHLVFYSRF